MPWSDLLRGRTAKAGATGTIRRLLLGIGTQAGQQLSGINVTSYYLPSESPSPAYLPTRAL